MADEKLVWIVLVLVFLTTPERKASGTVKDLVVSVSKVVQVDFALTPYARFTVMLFGVIVDDV